MHGIHGIDRFFVQLANAVVAVWRGRSVLNQASMFGDPEVERRSRFWTTVIAVIVTLFAVAFTAGAIFLLWWAFTSYYRNNP